MNNDNTNFQSKNENIFFQELAPETLEQLKHNPNYFYNIVLPIIYLRLLTITKKKLGIVIPYLDSNLSLEKCYLIVALAYYNFDTNKILELSTNFNEGEKEKLKLWLQEKTRYQALNILQETIFNYLKAYDDELENNLDSILKVITSKSNDWACDKALNPNIIINDLPKLDISSLDKLFINFLTSINAPQSWLNAYLFLKEKSLITYNFTSNENSNNSCCYFDKDTNTWKIKIDFTGDIKSFVTLSHEFAHYISTQKGKEQSLIIRELPSIYFENLACHYLETLGYNKKDINNIILSRKRNNLYIYGDAISILEGINKQINTGRLTKEDLMQPFIEANTILKENGQDKDFFTNIDKIASFICDEKIDTILTKGALAFNGIQYIISTIIAQELLNSKNPNTHSKMFNLTENLSHYNLQKVLTEFNISIFNQDTPKKVYIKSN